MFVKKKIFSVFGENINLVWGALGPKNGVLQNGYMCVCCSMDVSIAIETRALGRFLLNLACGLLVPVSRDHFSVF